MKSRVLDASEAFALTFVNGTGAAIASGAVALLTAGLLGVAQADIPIAGTGVLQVGGVFTVAKQSSDVMTQGQTVGFDLANQRADSTFAGNLIVVAAAGNGATTVDVRFPGAPTPLVFKRTVSSGEDAANAVVVNTGMGVTLAGPKLVQIESTGNVHRSPQGALTWGTSGNVGKLTINDTGLAVSEVVHGIIYP